MDELIKMELNLKEYENFFILLDKKAIWPLEDIQIGSDEVEQPSFIVWLDFKNKNNMSGIWINGYFNGRFNHELVWMDNDFDCYYEEEEECPRFLEYLFTDNNIKNMLCNYILKFGLDYDRKDLKSLKE